MVVCQQFERLEVGRIEKDSVYRLYYFEQFFFCNVSLNEGVDMELGGNLNFVYFVVMVDVIRCDVICFEYGVVDDVERVIVFCRRVWGC